MSFRAGGGEPRILEVNAVPIRLDHSAESYVVVALRDITGQKLAEHRLTESRRKLARRTQHLRRVNEELQQFAYVVSHDLKAPLRAVSNLVTWLEEDIGETLAPENRKQMELLRQRVTRMDGLINALLEYSRAGHRRGRTEPVEVGGLVREIVNSLSLPKAFRIEIADDLPALEADRVQLGQVFANLISNAVKHHDRADGRVWIQSRDVGDFFEFRVEDDGPGIPASHQERIFEMFQSLGPAEDGNNTGIGLALIKKMVERQGGHVSVDSEEGRGSVFRFTWPKVPAGDDA
jgi:signal transduction histidine kinase